MRRGARWFSVGVVGAACIGACSEVRLEGIGGEGQAGVVVVSAGPLASSSTGATSRAAQASSSVASSSSTGLAAPRLPPCMPETVDDFEDVAHTEATWEYATIEDGTLRVHEQGVYPVDRAPRVFDGCFLSLRVVELPQGAGTFHCHLDPDLDPDHDSANISFYEDEVWFEVNPGVPEQLRLRSASWPIGQLVAAIFEEDRIRVLGAAADGSGWTLLLDAPRPAYLDVPFSPCVFGLGVGDTFRVDDVNVLPPALHGLAASP